MGSKLGLYTCHHPLKGTGIHPEGSLSLRIESKSQIHNNKTPEKTWGVSLVIETLLRLHFILRTYVGDRCPIKSQVED